MEESTWHVGGKSEKLEGNWEPDRVVILEFESIEKAKEWLDSQEYRKARMFKSIANSISSNYCNCRPILSICQDSLKF